MDDAIVIIFLDGTFAEFPFQCPPDQFNMAAFKNMLKAEGGLLTPNAFVPRRMIKMVFRKGAMSAPQPIATPGQNAPTTESKQ